MSDSFEFKLHSPLTQEDWGKITDVEYENTASVTIQTPQGRRVRYVKLEVLDKIRAEIKSWQVDIHDNERDADKHDFVFERIFEIIDEYKAESEGEE